MFSHPNSPSSNRTVILDNMLKDEMQFFPALHFRLGFINYLKVFTTKLLKLKIKAKTTQDKQGLGE